MSKNILIVTGSDYSLRVYEAFRDAKNMGHKLYLLSDGSFEPTPGFFENHFKYDLRRTKEVLEYMRTQPIKFDAVTIKTSEWLTPLVALLAKEYKCLGNSPEVAFHCRSKYHMRKKMQEGGVPIPKFELCRNYEELLSGIHKVGIPCVAKPVGGNASYGTFMIRDANDLKDLKQKYETSIEYLKQKAVSEDMFAFSPEEMNLLGIKDHVDMVTDYLVEEFMAGPEISIDALTQNGKTSIIGIADQIRMKPPYFIQLAEKIPYVCTPKQKEEIEDILERTHRALGIKNSASHTEIIFTPEGPKVVEIGCRIGGDNIHDAVWEMTGVNLTHESILIALGIPRDYSQLQTKCHTAMEYILPDKKGRIEKIVFPDEIMNDSNLIEIYNFVRIGDEVAPPPQSFDFLGYVSVKGKTPKDAEENLKRILKKIKFHIQ